jgi:hypothetical protein
MPGASRRERSKIAFKKFLWDYRSLFTALEPQRLLVPVRHNNLAIMDFLKSMRSRMVSTPGGLPAIRSKEKIERTIISRDFKE